MSSSAPTTDGATAALRIKDGSELGTAVGLSLGSDDGLAVGRDDGTTLLVIVGDALGVPVWDQGPSWDTPMARHSS